MNTLTYEPPVITQCRDISGQWDGINWRLSEDWKFSIETGNIILKMDLKKRFKTDGGSIPAIFQNLYCPLGLYFVAFLIHDALYATEYLTRAEADWLLLLILQAMGASWFRRNSIWAAVKLGGGFVWKSHTAESMGEARQLVSGYYSAPGKCLKFGQRSNAPLIPSLEQKSTY